MRRAALLAALALAGCGGAAAPPPAHHTASAVVVPPAPVNLARARGTVRYCAPDSPVERRALARFNAAHGDRLRARLVPLTARTSPAQLAEVEAGLRGGRCDAAGIAGTWAAQLGVDGVALDLTGYARTRGDNFYPAALGANAYRGRQWAMPRALAVSVLYVHVNAAGDEPQTWDELYGDRSGGRTILVPGAGGPATADAFFQLLYAAGGRLSAVDGPAGRRALGLLERGWSVGAVRSGTDSGYADVAEAFARGEAKFLPSTSDNADALLRSQPPVVIARVPHFPGQPPRALVSTYSIAVARVTPRRAAALALVHDLTSRADMRLLAAQHLAPVLQDSYREGRPLESLEAGWDIRKALADAVPYPSLPGFDAISRAIGHAVHQVLTGDLTVAQALARMAAKVRAGARADGSAA